MSTDKDENKAEIGFEVYVKLNGKKYAMGFLCCGIGVFAVTALIRFFTT